MLTTEATYHIALGARLTTSEFETLNTRLEGSSTSTTIEQLLMIVGYCLSKADIPTIHLEHAIGSLIRNHGHDPATIVACEYNLALRRGLSGAQISSMWSDQLDSQDPKYRFAAEYMLATLAPTIDGSRSHYLQAVPTDYEEPKVLGGWWRTYVRIESQLHDADLADVIEASQSLARGSDPYAIHLGHSLLGRICILKTDHRNALSHLELSIEIPECDAISMIGPDYRLATKLHAAGHVDRVMEYFRRSLRLWPEGAGLVGRWERDCASQKPVDFQKDMAALIAERFQSK